MFPAGALVRPFETFDAVGAGVADMYHSADHYFGSKSPGFYVFSAAPYGLTADEMTSWVAFSGGQALWDELGAGFNIKPLLALNTGVQMGGWFTKEIHAPEDFKGLRYRMPGLGAEVLRRMGAIVVTTPADQIITALKSGAIDASEWVGPWLDMWLGLDQAADYYYYPGFHEPASSVTLGVNKAVWDGLGAADQAIVSGATTAELTRSLAEFNSENVKALKLLRDNPRIKLRRFDDTLIKAFGKVSQEVMSDMAARDPLTRRIYDSYRSFLAGVMDWGELSETGYRGTRRLALA